MRFGDMLTFRDDLFFEGAVQAEWFYQPELAKKVAENFVYHGNQYYGGGDGSGKKFTDTITFTRKMAEQLSDEPPEKPYTLAIAGYGTGKSHLAVALATLLSGADYQPATYSAILSNIQKIDPEAAQVIAENTKRPNLVLVLNGMRDFNLHYELLKAARKSLKLYDCDDQNLKKLNRALETASRFFERNAESMMASFEKDAVQFGYSESGTELINRIRQDLGEDDRAFDVINAVYEEINGNAIRWDEGVSAATVLETLQSEYCGISGQFSKIIIIFDEFGRYLEYASGTNTAHSGDAALQQIFECAQNFEGNLQIINFIQADIQAYLQRVDQTSNLSRYIGRYERSEKYWLSSNLETIFANLIQRTDKEAFNKNVVAWQNENETKWEDIFNTLNAWLPATGIWADYKKFRKVIVEGIYPLHPFSTYMLSKLSDYLQNRSSLVLLSDYIKSFRENNIEPGSAMPVVLPETLLTGNLFIEMLSAEEEGRQVSSHCIRYNNVLRKDGDKLSEDAKKILRANLALRILRCRTINREDIIHGFEIFTGLDKETIIRELAMLEVEYADLGYDENAACFDFLEDASGAYSFRADFRRERAKVVFQTAVFDIARIRELAGINEPQKTNFSINHRITTNEWQFDQELFPITELSAHYINQCSADWKNAITPDKSKGKLIWLYVNEETPQESIQMACNFAGLLKGTPILMMMLRDSEGLLENALCDYLTLEKLPDELQKKYGRYYQDKLQQTEENIQQAFERLKKDRLCIRTNAIEPLQGRLANALTTIFDQIYPAAVPFDFDGFASKQPSKARKAFCSINKLLLSGAISESTIHSFPQDVRNRFDATLFINSSYSWKVINKDYQLIPPQNKLALAAYEAIASCIPEGAEINLKDIIKMLVEPPYGMSDYEAVYMISVFLANYNYCIRLIYKDTVYNVGNWKDYVISDNKIDIAEIQKTKVKRINVNAVVDQFKALFRRIDSNTDISMVADLEGELDKLKNAEDLPEALQGSYGLAMLKLKDGKLILKQWDAAIEGIMNNYEKMINSKNLMTGLEAISDLPKVYSCFTDKDYSCCDEQKKKINQVRSQFTGYIEPKLNAWIDEQNCTDPERIGSYKHRMELISQTLVKLGYLKEATQVDEKAKIELSNGERLKERWDLIKTYNIFIQKNIVTDNVPYTSLEAWEDQGKEILIKIGQLADLLRKDAEPMQKKMKESLAAISAQISNISNEMNDIWNRLYSLKTIDEVKKILADIKRVSARGIPENDLTDFKEMEEGLSGFLSSVDVMMEEKNNRSRFEANYEALKAQYSDSEIEIDVLNILEYVAKGVRNELDQKDQLWHDKHLSAIPEGIDAIHSWKQDTEVLPNYLSDATISEYRKMKSAVEEILSKERIKDLVHTFSLLSNEEKQKCYAELAKLLRA